MNYYLPSPYAIKKNLDLREKNTLNQVKSLLNFSHFDPEWYFNKYKDIQDKIPCKDELIKSHFINSGYWEGRLPFKLSINKKFLERYYSSSLFNSETKRMDCYKIGALTSNIKFDLLFYNDQFNHDGNSFVNKDDAFLHFLKIGYLKLKLPYDIQKDV